MEDIKLAPRESSKDKEGLGNIGELKITAPDPIKVMGKEKKYSEKEKKKKAPSLVDKVVHLTRVLM